MRTPLAFAVLSLVASALAFKPGQDNVIVGVDSLPTLLTGPFAGQANPGFNRLTVLYAHQYTGADASISHYHAKGQYRLGREFAGGPINVYDRAVGVNGTTGVLNGALFDILPETAGVNIRLAPNGNGFYVNLNDAQTEWENLTIRPTSHLASFAAGTSERVTFESSGGRYTGSLGSANLALRMVALDSGLLVRNSDGTGDYAVGSDFALGTGNFAATPQFAVPATAPLGTVYTATFRVVDLNGGFGDSGTFRYRFSTVPEPASMAVLGLGLAAFRRRRKS